VNNLDVSSLKRRQHLNTDSSVISLQNVNNAFIHNCIAPEGIEILPQMDDNSVSVTVTGNEFSHAKKLITSSYNLKNFETKKRMPAN
jgi:hypothetical protein